MNVKNLHSIKRKQVLGKGLSVSLLAAAMLAAGGCSLVNEDLPDCAPILTDDSDKIMLQFSMESGAILSRASSRSDSFHTEEDSEFPSFEDAVNVYDLGLFIFLGSGTDAPLIAMNTSIATSSDSHDMINGSPGDYTVTMSVDRDDVDALLAEDAESVDFRVMILANCYTAGEDGGGNFSSLGAHLKSNADRASTFSEVVEAAEKWGFSIAEVHSMNKGDALANGVWKGYIPMYGTNVFNVKRETLQASTVGTTIYLGEVNLLRALAKMRVIDNIANKENGYPYISEVNFLSATDMAYSLPLNAVSYVDGTQIHADCHIHDASGDTSVQSDWSAAYGAYEYKLGTVSEGSNTRIGYIAEQEIADTIPSFLITVQKNAEDSETYKVPMTKYNGQEFKFNQADDGQSIPNIIRNHIYTLSVDDVETGGPLTLTLTVDDWDSEPIYVLEYMDVPVLGQAISWQAGTYANNDVDNGELTVNSFDEGNVTPAICTFRLDRPTNGVWTAHLITTEGVQGAFKFQTTDNDGGDIDVETVSGVIDGTDATLKIVPTDVSPAQKNVAILQISVTLADGTQMEADICKTDKASTDITYSNYQIIQNAK